MGLRRRIAERIATPLKRVGAETPILEEIPHKAEVITAFYYEAVQQHSQGQVIERLRIPTFAHGKAYGETAGFWYRVTFPKPIKNPTVVCVGEARKTTIRTKIIEKIPEIRIPEININIPDWEITMPTADDFVTLVKQFFGDWGAFNWMRDAIAWAIGNWEYFWWNSLFRPRGLEALNQYVLEPLRTSLDNIRVAINDTIGSINERIELIRLRVNEVTQDIIPALYNAWGIPHVMALTPLHVRNITSTGFEFQSYGKTTAYWIAIGTRT